LPTIRDCVTDAPVTALPNHTPPVLPLPLLPLPVTSRRSRTTPSSVAGIVL
jgi:hypothetical protein